MKLTEVTILVFPEDERLVDQEYLRYKYVLNTFLISTCSTGMYCCVTLNSVFQSGTGVPAMTLEVMKRRPIVVMD